MLRGGVKSHISTSDLLQLLSVETSLFLNDARVMLLI